MFPENTEERQGMSTSKLQLKIIEEIKLLPDEKLQELYDVIHFFRVGVETVKHNPDDIMQFAGCWEDMSDEEFETFSADIAKRRSNAFSRRIQRETLIS